MSGLPKAAQRIHQLDGSLGGKGSALDADEFDFKDKRRVRAVRVKSAKLCRASGIGARCNFECFFLANAHTPELA
jgi:hypothetical protein